MKIANFIYNEITGEYILVNHPSEFNEENRIYLGVINNLDIKILEKYIPKNKKSILYLRKISRDLEKRIYQRFKGGKVQIESIN